jgi:hypothetical protein
MNLFVIMVVGVMLAMAVSQSSFQGVQTIFNGLAGIWGTIVNALMGKPVPSWAGKNIAPPGTGGVHCYKSAGRVVCTKG